MHLVTINDFTEIEKKLLVNAWLCFDTDVKPDLKKLANLAGYTNTGSVSNAWGKIRRKLRGEKVDASPKSKSKKRAATEMDDGPSNRAKVGRGSKKAKTESVDDETGNGELLAGITDYAESE